MWKDKQQDDLLESLGFEVARWGWRTALHPKGDLDERLQRAYARGRRQELDPRVRLESTTLGQSLMWTGILAS